MKTTKLFSMLMAFAILAFATSCGDDDPVIVVEEGLPVADGFYLAGVGADLTASAVALKPAQVDAPSIGAMDRDGFYQAYMYLSAGSYNLLEVEGKAIVNTYGGTVTVVTGEDDANKECDESGYSLVEATADGSAFSIATEGLYVVAYDASSGEIVFDQITSVGIIGDATPGGWDSDTDMAGTIGESGASWEITEVILKPGAYKFRFNCRWAIDRRIDRLLDFDNSNGYSFFTNYAGLIDDLKPGNEGSNLEISERAVYTVTFAWSPATGVSGSVTRTGDAPELTFDPAEWNWGLIGSVTANVYDKDQDMYYKGESDGTYSWYTVVTFHDASQDSDAARWKFRTNDDWGTNLGGTLTTSESDLTFGSADLASPGGGDYYIVLQTSDDGETWSATMTEVGWGVIGTGSPQGNWDADIDMVAAIDGVNETYTITGDFTTDGWKIRAGDNWDYALGGDIAAPDAAGGDIVLSEAGNYTVVLSYDGSVYSTAVTKN